MAIARGLFGAAAGAGTLFRAAADRSRARFSRFDFAIVSLKVLEINFLDPHRSCQDVTFMHAHLWHVRNDGEGRMARRLWVLAVLSGLLALLGGSLTAQQFPAGYVDPRPVL